MRSASQITLGGVVVVLLAAVQAEVAEDERERLGRQGAEVGRHGWGRTKELGVGSMNHLKLKLK
jgi:hypothetical protein